MSKTLDQIYIANPITSNTSTDLMYFSQSPYTAGNDAGMTYANFAAQFGAPYTAAALTKTDDTNVTLTLGGSPSNALLHAASITAGWTGQLSVSRGGTGLGTLTTYALIAGGTTATGNLQQVSAGSAGQLLQSNGAGVLPSWTTATFPSGSGTLNHMLRSDGTNWVQTTNTTLTSGDVLAGVTSATIGNISLSANTISSSNTNGNLVLIPNGNGVVLLGGGTTALSTAIALQIVQTSGNPDMVIGSYTNNGTNAAVYYCYKSRSAAVGSFAAVQNGDILGFFTARGDDGAAFQNSASIRFNVDGAVSSGIVPGKMTISTVNSSGVLTDAVSVSSSQIVSLANPLPVGSGGLGINTTPTNGQIPIGNGSTYTAATLTAGTGISVTNGSGSITIASSGASPWVDQTTGSVTMTSNTGYTSDDGAALVTFTLPTTSAIGDWLEINGKGSGLWTIAQASGQQIKVGTSATTLGAGGSLSSVNQYDNVRLRCITANTIWTVVAQQSSGLTIV